MPSLSPGMPGTKKAYGLFTVALDGTVAFCPRRSRITASARGAGVTQLARPGAAANIDRLDVY